MKKKLILLLSLSVCLSGTLMGCQTTNEPKETLTIFNYSEYLDPDVLEQFTEETGIEIEYEEATTPEELYTKYTSGAISYDLVCSSDYMIQRFINEGKAQKVDYSSMEYSKNIGDRYWELSKSFDPNNEYALPYFWGTIGILYDTTKVSEPVDSWDVLFDGEYSNQIIMQDSMRDTFMITLKKLGYSLNTTNEDEIREAQQLLLSQKPDVEAYLVDEARDEVVAGNATMAVIYSGEAYLGHEYNNNLTYVVPKEGSNVWIDSWIITNNCDNTDAAKKFLDFLCRQDIATKNFEYIYYSTPNEAVVNSLDESLKSNPAIVPTEEAIENCEVCIQPDAQITQLYNDLWKELKAQ